MYIFLEWYEKIMRKNELKLAQSHLTAHILEEENQHEEG